jgi:hypothetical protein
MKTGQPTGGHYLGIMILVLLPLSIYAGRIFGRGAGFVQLFIMSTTLFLSMIPAIIETLTRLPLDHPLASGPNDPVILKALSGLVLIYLVGVSYQEVKYRKQQKAALSGALAPEQTK